MKTLLAVIMLVNMLIFPQPRKDVVCNLVDLYEVQSGNIAEVVENPFLDTDEECVIKAYGLGITAGTSATTFSPDELTKPYQDFLFIGKTLMLLEN